MTPPMPGHRGRNERGAALVEFSFVVVLFIALLYGLIAFGMAFALKQSMTNAASESARAAVSIDPAAPPPPHLTREEFVEEYAQNKLSWLGSKQVGLVPEAIEDNCDNDPFANPPIVTGSSAEICMFVRLTYDYKSYPLVPTLALPGFGYLFPDTITSQSAVQMPPDP